MRTLWMLLVMVLWLRSSPAQQWEVTGTMPFPVAGAELVVKDGLFYFLGGYADSSNGFWVTDKIQVYDPLLHTWQIAGSMNVARLGFVAGEYNNHLYYAGGTGLNIPIPPNVFSLESWDCINPPVIYNYHPECNRSLAGGVVRGDYLYMVGGLEVAPGSLPLSYIVEYHLPSGSVSYQLDSLYAAGDLPYEQFIAAISSNMYIFGGTHFVTEPEVYRFNMLTRAYDHIFTMPRERGGGASVVVDEADIYLIGGYDDLAISLDSVSIFHTYGGTYRMSSGPPLNYGRTNPMAAVYQNRIYTFGGVDEALQMVPYIEMLDLSDTTGLTTGGARPGSFELFDNFPNPFNGETRIPFRLDRTMELKLEIYSIFGERLRTLLDEVLPAGRHEVSWDARDKNGLPVGSGIYFYKLQSATEVVYKKLILAK